jgi:hypothetical protein
MSPDPDTLSASESPSLLVPTSASLDHATLSASPENQLTLIHASVSRDLAAISASETSLLASTSLYPAAPSAPVTTHASTRASSFRSITVPPLSDSDDEQSSHSGAALAQNDIDSDSSDEDETEWKKTDWDNTPDISSFDEGSLQPKNHFPSRSRPIAYFEVFLMMKLLLI